MRQFLPVNLYPRENVRFCLKIIPQIRGTGLKIIIIHEDDDDKGAIGWITEYF
jgi:hypothetical protein